MIIACDTHTDTTCVCISRNIPERGIYAGCLFYAFGSVPHYDAILNNANKVAIEAVAGELSHAIEAIIQSDNYNDLSQAAISITVANKKASKDVWELGQQCGQGIYIGGLIAYFCDHQYVATSFGGAAAMLLNDGRLLRLDEPSPDGIIRDAIGARPGWTGRFIHGALSARGTLFGATGTPRNWQSCEQQLDNFAHSHVNLHHCAEILRKQLDVRSTNSAVIAFSPKSGGDSHEGA